MTEHIKMTPQEAKQKAEAIQERSFSIPISRGETVAVFQRPSRGNPIAQATPGLDQELVCVRARGQHRYGNVLSSICRFF